MQSLQQERAQERVGLPCSPAFHQRIENAVIELREHGQGGGAVVDLSRFLHLGMANAQRYSLIHQDDFAAVLAFQSIFPGLFSAGIERLHTASVPGQKPRAWDYAVQIAAFYFAFTHEVYGMEFRRMLNPVYRRRVLVSRAKWQAAIAPAPQQHSLQQQVAPQPQRAHHAAAPPGFAAEPQNQHQLEELQELQRRQEQEMKEFRASQLRSIFT
jgi:hypothetical protein